MEPKTARVQIRIAKQLNHACHASAARVRCCERVHLTQARVYRVALNHMRMYLRVQTLVHGSCTQKKTETCMRCGLSHPPVTYPTLGAEVMPTAVFVCVTERSTETERDKTETETEYRVSPQSSAQSCVQFTGNSGGGEAEEKSSILTADELEGLLRILEVSATPVRRCVLGNT